MKCLGGSRRWGWGPRGRWGRIYRGSGMEWTPGHLSNDPTTTAHPLLVCVYLSLEWRKSAHWDSRRCLPLLLSASLSFPFVCLSFLTLSLPPPYNCRALFAFALDIGISVLREEQFVAHIFLVAWCAVIYRYFEVWLKWGAAQSPLASAPSSSAV